MLKAPEKGGSSFPRGGTRPAPVPALKRRWAKNRYLINHGSLTCAKKKKKGPNMRYVGSGFGIQLEGGACRWKRFGGKGLRITYRSPPPRRKTSGFGSSSSSGGNRAPDSWSERERVESQGRQPLPAGVREKGGVFRLILLFFSRGKGTLPPFTLGGERKEDNSEN